MINQNLLNQILVKDFLQGIQEIPDNTIDLIIADPPYNLNKDFGLWKEKENKDKWLPWSKQWIIEAKRVLKPNGSIFIYGIHNHLCWLQCFLYEIEMVYRRQIIWQYENGFAGYSAKTLAANYEPILWFTKGKKYTYHAIREPYKSQERLKYKITKNGKVWTPNPDGKLAGDIWNFPTLAGKRFAKEKVAHPTQKPLSLTLRIINHFSNVGDVVLVPFVGSGTECVAAKMGNRKFIGFEINEKYVTIARKRLEEIHPLF